MSLNSVCLQGTLGRELTLRFTKAENFVATFSLVTVAHWADEDGKIVESKEWHNIPMWGEESKRCCPRVPAPAVKSEGSERMAYLRLFGSPSPGCDFLPEGKSLPLSG